MWNKFTISTLTILAAAIIFSGCGKEKNRDRDDDSPRLTSSDRALSVSNLKQISSGIMTYCNDYDDYLPASPGVLLVYLSGSTEIFIAPWDKESVKAEFDSEKFWGLGHGEQLFYSRDLITPANSSYVWLVPAHKKIYRFTQPSETPILFEKPWLFPKKTDKIAVAYLDGRVETVSISGASEMNCRQITAKLTEKLADKELRAQLLRYAEREDEFQYSGGKIEFRLVIRYVEEHEREINYGNPEYMQYIEIEDGKPVVRSYLVETVPLMTGENIEKATVIRDEFSGQLQIMLTFNSEGAEEFKQVTQANIGRQLAIVINGKLYCAPRINEAITGGRASVSGNFTLEEANKIASDLVKNNPKRGEKR